MARTQVSPVIVREGLEVVRRVGLPFCVLRTRELDALPAAELGEAFGVTWPTEPNTGADDGAVGVFWLAPGEWAVTGLDPAEVSRRAAGALGGALHHVADTTDGLALFAVSGPRARGLLAQGCGLDLHPRTFPSEACAQTLFAQVPVLLHRVRSDDSFHLAVGATLAEHLTAWFKAAAPFAGT